jgi:hypothetical protein
VGVFRKWWRLTWNTGRDSETTSLNCCHWRICSSPRWHVCMGNDGGMILTGENRRSRGKITCPSSTLPSGGWCCKYSGIPASQTLNTVLNQFSEVRRSDIGQHDAGQMWMVMLGIHYSVFLSRTSHGGHSYGTDTSLIDPYAAPFSEEGISGFSLFVLLWREHQTGQFCSRPWLVRGLCPGVLRDVSYRPSGLVWVMLDTLRCIRLGEVSCDKETESH